MKKKVIYISWVKLNNKIAQDWYLNYLLQSGLNVEYWDISGILRQKFSTYSDSIFDIVRNIKSWKNFELLIQSTENRNAVYVVLISPSWPTRRPFQILSKHLKKVVFIDWGEMPYSKAARIEKIFYWISHNPIKLAQLTLEKLLWFVMKKFKVIKPFDIIFYVGDMPYKKKMFSKKAVPINFSDYEDFLRIKVKDKNSIVNYKYAVFIDQNLPYHLDFELLNLPTVTAKKYYKSLNNFFSLIEKQYKIRIVIAAHPTADIKKSEFYGRQVFKMQTAELIKDAEFVLMHTTSAVSFAILNFKPIIFFYTEEMFKLKTPTILDGIFSLSKYLGEKAYNIDMIYESRKFKIQQPRKQFFTKYKYRYLTSKLSENILSSEIFLREINSI
ncbi:hypothetical protein FIT61_02715 [Candidatus Methylopumilus rimovensis]|uniref:Uncharacterized protein n=1 Tax=Candidatus Methylopumilus rimovensis TaxID=2588535 RepID=A0AAE6FTD0_9PROT|nr:hypothetical protein [Candidatus Methylopumilus rimovensis]QDD13373.1 hypothetical protein FIT61_02715 [Candidatus Methylopumilus rimovensis]